ncbi:MAG: MBL fold metallo-hydrolase, partial [Christensenellales bacterium]
PVYMPALPEQMYALLADEPYFGVRVVEKGLKTEVGSIKISFAAMSHPIPSYAVSFCADGKRLVYSGDTNWNPDLAKVAQGADAFLCDTGFLERDRGEQAPHLSAAQAGRIAREAEVLRLYLTHIYPHYEEKELLEEARLYFEHAEVIREMQPIEIGK